MKITGKLGKYSWIIDESEWTTVYIGDPNDDNTICDGFVVGNPEEALLAIIAHDIHKTRQHKKRMDSVQPQRVQRSPEKVRHMSESDLVPDAADESVATVPK